MKTKKILAILIAAVMMFALLPASLFAATVSVSNATELANAITAAASGDTIVLTADITDIQQMEISKPITIDMKGFDISGKPTSYTAFKVVAGGDLTLSNTGMTQSKLLVADGDAVEYNYEGIRIAGGGKATVGPRVSIETGLPVFIYGDGTAGSAELDVYGKLVVTDDLPDGDAFACIQGNGSAGKGGTIINVRKGAEIVNPFSAAMYIPQAGVVNVYEGTITGKQAAIAIKSGTLNIYGGTLRATGPATIPTSGWSNGMNGSGCAIQIESNDSYVGNIIVNITGGTIISDNGYAVYEYLDTVTDGDTDPTPTTVTMVTGITISGGTFYSAPGLSSGMLLSQELTTKSVVSVDGATFQCASVSEVTANADVTFTVVIPASVDFGTITKDSGTKTIPFEVTVENALLEYGFRIKVTNTTGENMVMRDRNGAGNNTLPFVMDQTTFTFSGNGTDSADVTCDTANLQAAGSYKGYMTFTIDYEASAK